MFVVNSGSPPLKTTLLDLCFIVVSLTNKLNALESLNKLKSLKAGFSYQIVNKLPTPSIDCLGTIYLIGGSDIDKNKYAEYICIFNNAKYSWEMLGIINSEVDLTGYVTKNDFDAFTAIALTAEDVTDSSGHSVSVAYDIPKDLYDA